MGVGAAAGVVVEDVVVVTAERFLLAIAIAIAVVVNN